MSQSKKIVLIDDEAGVLTALKLMLQLKGFTVQDFSDSEKALKYIIENTVDGSSQTIDYILCDLRMPNKTGMDILTETRGHAKNIPFFMMSGHADQSEQELALKLGASAFLDKPFDLDKFMTLLSG